MKIFFHASIQPTHDPYLRDLNLTIYEHLKNLGHELTSEFFIKMSSGLLTNPEFLKDEAKKQWKNQKRNMQRADVFVIGPCEQSLGIGYCICLAEEFSKPIIVLSQSVSNAGFLYHALDYEKIFLYDCNSQNYKKITSEALTEAQKLIDKRFTLLLPPDIVDILKANYENTGQSRSDFIRGLIRQTKPKGNV